MGKIENDEQWLLDGSCYKCRRKKYCGSPCSRNKRAKQQAQSNMFKTTAGQLPIKESLSSIYGTFYNK